jgi:hypothetical protein
MVEKNPVSQKQIRVELDVLYNIEKMGDSKTGPGFSLNSADIIF